ncbi:AMP-binding protein [Sphingobium sp. LSP13-1-1.1]|uniref:AMP-binding protein n=1 Tax=Sphingobium sp. LSP13-1-1.1 TaxID=3135234 RepID=UPI00343E3C69
MTMELPLTSPEKARQYRAAGLWQDVTLSERFLAQADRFADKLAIIVDGRRATYRQLQRDVLSVANGLLAEGLEPGDVIAGQLPNSYEIPVLHLACNMVGMLYMPLHDSWRALEVGHLLAQAKVKVVISRHLYRDFDYVRMIRDLRPDLPDLKTHFVIGESAGDGIKPFEMLVAAEPLGTKQIASLRPDPDYPAALMLSGGTTAISKISRYSSNDLQAMLNAARDGARFVETDVAAALAPAGTGATGYVYPVLMPLLNGGTSVMLPHWSNPEDAADLMVKENCTYATAIPAQLIKLLPTFRSRPRDDFHSLRVITNAGAPLPYDAAREVEELTGAVIQSIYGATDAGTPTLTTADDPREKRLGTVGRIVPGCECEIRDSDGNALPAGTVGEVTWRGADKSWGYLGADDQTRSVFTQDHFYKSGDLGQFDEDGYLKIVGRIKDMILRGGRNVSPLVIEEALIKHVDVQDVAVAAMPDPVLGERACAFVIARPGAGLELAGLLEFLRGEGLATWQLPERLEIMQEFPRSAGGKTLKRELTALVTEKLKAELEQGV